jgi:hypothetical protein
VSPVLIRTVRGGESQRGQWHAYRSIGESWFVAVAEVEVETGCAMFFLAFLPRFLVILNDDLEQDELGAHSHQLCTQRTKRNKAKLQTSTAKPH